MGKKLLRVAGWILAAIVVLLLALVAHVYVEGRPSQGRPQYVAMGSSFAAGPAITEAAEDSPWFCARSRDNYAHQLARLRGLSLVDVTCGGATTRHVLDGGQLLQPAQIDAVTPETELVTVTIGGNDIAYLGNLMAMGCDENTPWMLRTFGACRIRSVETMTQGVQEVHRQLVAIIEAVRTRAPQATIVLVNYQTILPQHGTCGRLGLTETQVAQMRIVADALAEATYAAAEGHGALLADAARLSRGHDVCAGEPWMKGMRPPGGLLDAPLHPTLAGMTAIAGHVNALLGSPSR